MKFTVQVPAGAFGREGDGSRCILPYGFARSGNLTDTAPAGRGGYFFLSYMGQWLSN